MSCINPLSKRRLTLYQTAGESPGGIQQPVIPAPWMGSLLATRGHMDCDSGVGSGGRRLPPP